MHNNWSTCLKRTKRLGGCPRRTIQHLCLVLGKDDCQESYVTYEQLMELKALCEEVLKTKDASKLPPTSGFFFGSTEVDEYYFQDLEDTIKQLSGLDPEGSYYYQASW